MFGPESAGYIDISESYYLYLDSIYRELIVLLGTDSIQLAINNAIPTYSHYDSLVAGPRSFPVSLACYPFDFEGELFNVDSSSNNMQFRYDSLRGEGYSQEEAIALILTDQELKTLPVSFSNGRYDLVLQRNALGMLRMVIPGLTFVENKLSPGPPILLYPNPIGGEITLEFTGVPGKNEQADIANTSGKVVKTVVVNQKINRISIGELPPGVYILRLKNGAGRTGKFIKSLPPN